MATLQRTDQKRFYDNYFFKAFFFGLGLAFLVFIPFIIIDGGRFLFYGDFNVQQIPFYQLAHRAVRSGSLGWNQYTDLGVNFIGSYSFYLLGSPFFWITLPFPNEALQYLMGPLFILKFACASLSGYTYLHRYVKKQNTALLGALLYAFSGFSIYNIFFNHFHEAIICFPLMLAALDEYMYKRRRGLFAITVAACCITNYYFFVGQVTFTLIYFFLRLICKSWHISIKDLLLLALEAVLGVGISCAILVPSVLSVIQNSRTNNLINGWNAVMYNHNQRYLHIIECLFFPPDLPARPNFTPDSESKWSSLGAWLPLFGMTGVIGWLQIKRKHWLKKFIWILFLMVMVPFLNSSFQLFNSSFYGRWLYMLTLMMSLATIMALEYRAVNWKRAVTWSTVFTASISLIIGFMPKITTQSDGSKSYEFGLMAYPTRFWAYTAVSLICLALVVYLFQFKISRRRFFKTALSLVSAVSVLYSVYFIALGKTQSLDPYEHIIPYALNGGKDINLPDMYEDNVRVDYYESLDNSGMFWGVKTIQTFHSIVPGSIMDFYKSIDVKRDVGSRPETDKYAVRGLTSVKWLFDDDHDSTYFAGEQGDSPSMPGWIYHSNANGFDIWENEYYVPMGFTYDHYITKNEFEATNEKDRINAMMRAIVLDDDQVKEYQHILSPLRSDNKTYTEDSYLEDCRNRAKLTCSSFTYTTSGFTAEMDSPKENLVFFSVPYEPGWSATVNGEAVDIETVNVGFMAVPVPQGEKVIIEFSFRTPGLIYGVLMTLFSSALLLVYLFLSSRMKPARKNAALGQRNYFSCGSFKEYKEAQGAQFARLHAMTPKEMKIPKVPDYANSSYEDDTE